MPIYEYRCKDCGFQQEFLRKVSDAPLTTCPGCGKETLDKMLTAAGFQLKGTGWYATDFKGGAKPATAPSVSGEVKGDAKPAAAGDAAPASSSGESKTESKPEVAAPASSGGASA